MNDESLGKYAMWKKSISKDYISYVSILCDILKY